MFSRIKLEAEFYAYCARAKTEPEVATALKWITFEPDKPNHEELWDHYESTYGPQMAVPELKDVEFFRFFPNICQIYIESVHPLDLSQMGIMPCADSVTVYAPLKTIPFIGHSVDSIYVDGAPGIDTSDLPQYPNLRDLMLQNCPPAPDDSDPYGYLVDIENLKVLDLSGCELTSLEQLPPLPQLESLIVCQNRLTSLKGLERFPALNFLAFYGNDITCLEPLKHVPGLVHLNISHCPIKDPGPIAELRLLEDFCAEHVGISDIGFLAGLTAMTELNLKSNAITDITPLANMTELEMINVSKNLIESIEPLAGLPKLDHVWAYRNMIRELGGLPPKLKKLILRNNLISTIAPGNVVTREHLDIDLSHNALTSLANIDRIQNLWWLDICHNKVSDISALAGMKELDILYATANAIEDLRPLSSVKNLSSLKLNGNRVRDVSALKDLEHLDHLELKDNPLGTAIRKTDANAPMAVKSKVLRDFCENRVYKASDFHVDIWS